MPSASELPTGTVSFLFSDVEGSTRLLERFGDDLTNALIQHHALIADAVAAHDGVVFETVGDAVYAAFEDPLAATLAGVDAQAAMHRASWGEVGPLRIRAAVHRGPVEHRGAHYVGPALFRTARILALGHGGQTLASAEIATAVGRRLPPPVHLRSLGHHLLKDLVAGEDVHQVDRDDLPSTFPPLRSAETRIERVPHPISRFIDRPALVSSIGAAFEHGSRLVTLTGPGGVGKTRLAIEAARTSASWTRDGVVFVDLVTTRDPGEVLESIAVAIGLRPIAGETTAAALTRWLSDRSMLLVLDNFEQVLDAGPSIAQLLGEVPATRLLITSRERLRVRGETVVAVDPLPLATDPSRGANSLSPAVALFADRAGIDPDSWSESGRATALRICAQVDGLALAIELAAARAGSVPLELLEGQLSSRTPLAGSGPRDLPERQQTMSAVVGWSRDLLTPSQQRLFDRLGVFRGSVPIEAAGRLVHRDPGDPALMGDMTLLAERSLLQPPSFGPTRELRFGMLETTRVVAASALDRHARRAAERRHATWMADLVERAEEGMLGHDDVRWMARLDLDWPDIERAFERARDAGDAATCHRIAAALWRYAYVRSTTMMTVVDWCATALAMDSVAARARARTLLSHGAAGVFVLAPDETEPSLREAIELLTLLGPSIELAEAHQTMGAIAINHRLEGSADLRRAAEMFEAIGDERGLGASLMGLAMVGVLGLEGHRLELDEIPQRVRRATIHARAGMSPVSKRDAISNASAVMADLGLSDEAVVYGLEAADLRAADPRSDPFTTAGDLENLGKVLLLVKSPEAAALALGCAYQIVASAGVHTLAFAHDEKRLLAIVRISLGSSAEAYLAEGRALDPEAAFDLAVGALRAAHPA